MYVQYCQGYTLLVNLMEQNFRQAIVHKSCTTTTLKNENYFCLERREREEKKQIKNKMK